MAGPDEKLSEATASSEVLTQIAYCDHLDVYFYRDATGTDYLFDTKQLEQSIQSYLNRGDTRNADFMANLTAMVRQCPHHLVWFDREGKPHERTLEPKKLEDVLEGGTSASK
jgi:hypothetical protein